MYKIRTMLRNLFVALGTTTMPYLVYAGYGMVQQADPETLTVPLEGRVVSEETGEPVEGIYVSYQVDPNLSYPNGFTDSDGRFILYAPEAESYDVTFFDSDGYRNGGFFSYKNMIITQSERENLLMIRLHKEGSKVTVIQGTVLSKGAAREPIKGIRVRINFRGTDGMPYFSGFEGFSDNDGNFSIQVPERDTYSINFDDINLDYFSNYGFRRQRIEVTFDEIQNPLDVELTKKDEDNK